MEHNVVSVLSPEENAPSRNVALARESDEPNAARLCCFQAVVAAAASSEHWPAPVRQLLAVVCTNLRKSFSPDASDENRAKWRRLNASAVRKRCACATTAPDHGEAEAHDLQHRVNLVLEVLGFQLVTDEGEDEDHDRWRLTDAATNTWSSQPTDLERCAELFANRGREQAPVGVGEISASSVANGATAFVPSEDSRVQIFDDLVLSPDFLHLPAHIVSYPRGSIQLVHGPSERSVLTWASTTGSGRRRWHDTTDDRVRLVLINRLPNICCNKVKPSSCKRCMIHVKFIRIRLLPISSPPPPPPIPPPIPPPHLPSSSPPPPLLLLPSSSSLPPPIPPPITPPSPTSLPPSMIPA